jgi:hypothetical protein
MSRAGHGRVPKHSIHKEHYKQQNPQARLSLRVFVERFTEVLEIRSAFWPRPIQDSISLNSTLIDQFTGLSRHC